MRPPRLARAASKEKPAAERPPPQVVVMTVAVTTMQQPYRFVAQTESSQRVDIVARASGFLDKIASQESEPGIS